MARYNEILVGRFNRLAQKLLSMKGPPVMATLHDELHLQIPIFHGNENRYLESWMLYGFAGNPGGSPAGNVQQLRARNPLGSNVIAVFSKIAFSYTTAAAAAQNCTLSHRALSTDLGSSVSVPNTRLDPRGQSAPTLVFSSANPATNAPLDIIDKIFGPSGNGRGEFIVTRDQEIPLLPGDVLQMETGTPAAVGEVDFFTMWWRERFLEDSERS